MSRWWWYWWHSRLTPCHRCREPGAPGCWRRSCSGTWWQGSADRSVRAASGQRARVRQCVTCPHPCRSGNLRTAPGSRSGPVPCTSVSVPGHSRGEEGGQWGAEGGHPPCGATGQAPGTLGGCRGPSAGADPCPADLRARWALAWMGVLLGAACLLLLLLLKKEDVKGERCPSGGHAWPGTPPPGPSLTASPPHRLAEVPEG